MSTASRWARTIGAALACSSGLVSASTSHAASPTLQTGFMDNAVMTSSDRDVWVDRARSVGASRVRIALAWRSVAPTAAPPGTASNPAWPGYRWSSIDDQVRSLIARGLTPLISVNEAPVWAEAPGRPQSVRQSAWKPDVAAFGAFMTAVATRYSGAFVDAGEPSRALPRVDEFQIWNEPNLNLYLAPQYEDGRPYAPAHFRRLVNAGYDAVKGVQPSAKVVAAGVAPFGDPASRNAARTRPVAFMRSALCLNDELDKVCSDGIRADAVSLHPYAVDRPGRHAFDPDDATVPDYNRIATVVNAGRRAGTIGPKLPEYWVTEVSYDSNGPDPDGVPLPTRARYVSEAMWRLWRVGVNTVIWYLMRDAAPSPSYASTYQSGIFYRNGRRKSDARAFRFPLLVTGKSRKRMNVWFRTPSEGTVTIQVRRRGNWVSVAKKRGLPRYGVATVKVNRDGASAVRGIAGKATSYVWDIR